MFSTTWALSFPVRSMLSRLRWILSACCREPATRSSTLGVSASCRSASLSNRSSMLMYLRSCISANWTSARMLSPSPGADAFKVHEVAMGAPPLLPPPASNANRFSIHGFGPCQRSRTCEGRRPGLGVISPQPADLVSPLPPGHTSGHQQSSVP